MQNKKKKWLRGFLYRVMRPVLNFLADKKVVSSIAINNEKVKVCWKENDGEDAVYLINN